MTEQQEGSGGLRRRAAHALHGQLTERLIEQIGQLANGAQLPTEQELMVTYDVSRTTVRRAIRALVDRGVLVRRRGKGTFVQRPEVTHSLDHLSPFFAVLSAAGKPPQTEIIEFGWCSGPDVPPELSGTGTDALSYQRLYFTSNAPHALLHVRIARPFADGITQEDLKTTPVMHVLERKYDLILRHAEYTIRSTAADTERAQCLQLPLGTPLLVMNRLTRTTAGAPVEYTTHYLDPTVYQLSVNIDERCLLRESQPWSLHHTVR